MINVNKEVAAAVPVLDGNSDSVQPQHVPVAETMPVQFASGEVRHVARPAVSKPVERSGNTMQAQEVSSRAAVEKGSNPDVHPAVKKTDTGVRVAAESTMTPAMQEQAEDVSASADQPEELEDSLQVVSKHRREFTPEEKSQQAYAAAMKFYNEGRKQESKSSLTEALSYSTENPDAYRLLAVIYFEDGRADLASEVIDKGLLVHAGDQNLLRLELQVLVQQKQYKPAIDLMEKKLKLTSPEDLGYLAGLYQKDNDHLNAVKTYAQALQLVPSKSVWWMGQGISLEVMKQYKQALQSYQKSINTGQLPGKLADYAIGRMNFIKQHNADSVS